MNYKLPSGYKIESSVRVGDYHGIADEYWLELMRWQPKRWFRKARWRVVARTFVGYWAYPKAVKIVTRELTRFAVCREAARG